MKKEHDIIAVDISKDQLVACGGGTPRCLPYTKQGMWWIVRHARKQDSALVVFEATGGYESKLRDYLEQAGVAWNLVNAARVRAFAVSEGVRAKTDPCDARMIHRFAVEKKLQPQSPAGATQRELASLMDRRDQLVDERKREKNRLSQATAGSYAAKSIRRSIRFLDKETKLAEAEIRSLVQGDRQAKATVETMLSVEGVGFWTSCSLLAYLPELEGISRNRAASLAGLAPYNRDSGKHCGKRMVEGGRGKVRKNLFMAARSASVHNPVIREYVGRLLAKGKYWKVAIVAAMRKLLVCVQSRLRKAQEKAAGNPGVGGKGCLGVQGAAGRAPCV